MAEVILNCKGTAAEDVWAFNDDPDPSSTAKALVVELRKIAEFEPLLLAMGRSITVTLVKP